MTTDPIVEEPSSCAQCQKEAVFMCSSCGHQGPRYCSTECQKQHWKTKHYKTCKTRRPVATTENIQLQDLSSSQQQQNEEKDQDEEEELADDLRFYTNQIYRIIKPVVACIFLSIFWVKVAFSGDSDFSPTRPSYVQVPGTTTTFSGSDSSSSGSSSSNIGSSFINAAIIIGQIIGVTIIIVFLFKKGWIKVLVGFFMIVVLLLLGFMTYLLLLNLVQVFFIPLDYITMVFALWNFAMVGLVSIFWKGPLWLQQSYLTIMSSLMAFSLTGLEQWTTWILLGLLAIWDLIAVLCPFGPLRLLIESSKTQQREVPALLYSVNAVWFMMASSDHLRLSNSMLSPDSLRPTSFIQEMRRSHDGFVRLPDETQPQQPQQQEHTTTQPQSDDEDAERSGLKLGLGDFVFYSVLVARAAMYDWITTVCCTIAVLTGLTATIFLLAIYKKALPALPISIAFGILFYFVAKQVLVPYIGTLCVFGMVGL